MSELTSLQSKMSELQFELAESKEQLSAMTETNDQLSSEMATMQAELDKVICVLDPHGTVDSRDLSITDTLGPQRVYKMVSLLRDGIMYTRMQRFP